MHRALTPLLPEDHRSIEKRSCKRRDSNERPNYQNVSFSLSSTASFFDWSQSHCFSLLRLLFPFLTLFYGNDGTKFPKKAERRIEPLSSSSPARRGQYGKSGNLCHHESTRMQHE